MDVFYSFGIIVIISMIYSLFKSDDNKMGPRFYLVITEILWAIMGLLFTPLRLYFSLLFFWVVISSGGNAKKGVVLQILTISLILYLHFFCQK